MAVVLATMKLKKTRTLYCLVALILIRIVVFLEKMSLEMNLLSYSKLI